MLAMLVWTGSGAILLFILMAIDSLFTKYKDLEEIKHGNIAVTTRFVMKLFAQGYILAQSITSSNDLFQALFASAISFIILFVIELIVRSVFTAVLKVNLDEGTKQGNVAYAILAGSLHVVGALILGACL